MRGVRRVSALGLVALLVIAGTPAPQSDAVTSATDHALPAAPRPVATGSDFDRDGYADLAVSGEDWSGEGVDGFPGVVTVLYGSPQGLTTERRQRWTAADFRPGDRSEELGEALAAGDFDGDGYSDLAIGIAELPLGDVSAQNAGRVRIVYGSPAGLTRARSQQWSQDTPGIRGRSEGEDGFGSVIVAADFGRGPEDDLVVGVGGENGHRGAVNVIYGSPVGLTANGNQLWSQTTRGVPGRRSVGRDMELFGTSLAAAEFAGSGHADLAIGVPGDRIGGAEDAGSVNVLYGSAAGLTTRGAELWSQRSRGVKGIAEAMDGFGSSLAAGHFAGRETADLAIGVPEENGGRGLVQVIYGSSRGLSAKGDQLWSNRTKGLGGRKQLTGEFGLALTTGHFGRDEGGRRFGDLAVGAWEAGDNGTGVVEVIYGSSKGLTPKHSRAWSLDSRGIEGSSDLGSDFGRALVAGNFGIDVGGRPLDDLVVADSWYSNGGAFSVICGSPAGLTAQRNRLWTVDDLGQPGLQFLGHALGAG